MPFGSDYTGIRAMYEVISTAVDTIENDELRELFLVAASGLLLWLVLLGSGGLVCCLYTAKKQMSQTNRSMPDEVCKWPCTLSVNSSLISQIWNS